MEVLEHSEVKGACGLSRSIRESKILGYPKMRSIFEYDMLTWVDKGKALIAKNNINPIGQYNYDEYRQKRSEPR